MKSPVELTTMPADTWAARRAREYLTRGALEREIPFIERAIRETVEECARICIEETDIVEHRGWERPDDGRATLGEAAKNIRALLEPNGETP